MEHLRKWLVLLIEYNLNLVGRGDDEVNLGLRKLGASQDRKDDVATGLWRDLFAPRLNVLWRKNSW